MIVQLTVRRGKPVCKVVASYREASEAVRQFIGNRGASQLPKHPFVIADGGAIVAHVSYNGPDREGGWRLRGRYASRARPLRPYLAQGDVAACLRGCAPS